MHVSDTTVWDWHMVQQLKPERYLLKYLQRAVRSQQPLQWGKSEQHREDVQMERSDG
jgi:hypothetical protein